MKRFTANPSVLVAVSCLALLVVLGGCVNKKPEVVSATPIDRPAIVPSTPPQSDLPGDKPATTARNITVYAVVEDKEGNQKLEPKEVSLPSGDAQTPAAFALKTLIEDPKSPLPKGTTLNAVKISPDGVATADFSHQLKDNFPGGDTAEALLINGVVSTLGQFKSVKSVQFLLDGKKIDSLGGNQTLDEPLPVPQASGAGDKNEAPEGGG